MMKILSSFEQMVLPSTQQAIENAAANCGAEQITLKWANENSDERPIYDAYDENESLVFSIDTDQDVIFER